MSIDERLRQGLAPHQELGLVSEDEALGVVVRRVRKRRRNRMVAVGAVLVGVVAASIVVPAELQHDGAPPAGRPTTPHVTRDASGPNDSGVVNQAPVTTPIDGVTWTSVTPTRTALLGTLRGTGLERYGPDAVRHFGLATVPSSMSLFRGNATIRIGVMGHPTTPVATGTYRVRDHRVELRLDGRGTVSLRWALAAGHLRLEYVADDLRHERLDGIPLSAVLRLTLTSAPFARRLDY